MPVKRTLFIVLLLSTLAFLSADLVWDSPVAIRQGVNIEWFRTGIETDDGCAIYVWSDTTLGGRDLWAQKVDANGNMVWGDPILIDGKHDRQEDPVITKTTNGDYIIAWIDFSTDADGDVYAQKINNNGDLLWQEGGKPVCVLPSEQIGLNMEADNDGGAFILWADRRNIGYDIYGQRISASGDPLWTVNGIPIANGPGDEVQNTMFPDGLGGMMVAYVHTFNNNADIYAKHFNASGVMSWDEPLGVAVGPGNQSSVRMARLTDGDFVLVWTNQAGESETADSDIHGQKINIAGQKLWSEPYIVFSDSDQPFPEHQNQARIQATSDNAAVVVWEDKRLSSDNTDLFAQKIASNGNKLWDPSGIVVSAEDFDQGAARLTSDGAGGVFIVWDDYRNGNSPNEDIYAQRLSASGEALWEENGMPICTASFTQTGGLVKVSGNNVYINWLDIRNGSDGIYYQVVDFNGNIQLAENGVQVFWGLSGDVPKGEYKIFPRENDTIMVWQDNRFSNIGSRIYYQILDPNGNALLETNGRPITVDHEGYQEHMDAVITENGELGVVWLDNRSGTAQVYTQLINLDGSRAWGDNGLKVIAETAESSGQNLPKISYLDGSFYVGWWEWFYIMFVGARNQVYGQRIQDGQRMWGPSGVQISLPESEYDDFENQLETIKGDVFAWTQADPIIFTKKVMLKKVKHTDGSAADGWPNHGHFVTENVNNTNQLSPSLSLLPNDNISIIWKDQRDGIFSYYTQFFSPTGTKLYDVTGVPLTDTEYEQDAIQLAQTNTGVIAVWAETGTDGEPDIKAKKYITYPNVSNWGDDGIHVVQRNMSQDQPTLTIFDGGGSFVAWTEFYTEDSDIYYNYLNPDGSLVYSNEGAVLCDNIKSQYMPVSTLLNDNAYVIWADGLSSGKTEILGLYAQRVTKETVSVDDDSNAPAINSLKLAQNYPNPFNPTTTISLNLAQPAELDLSIYNSKGQLVRRLHSGNLHQGDHLFVWNGKDQRGNSVASGVYFYKAEIGSQSQTKKMLLMK
jgi:hypothetical protein